MMSVRRSRSRPRGALVALATALVLVAACGPSSSEKRTSADATASAAAAKKARQAEAADARRLETCATTVGPLKDKLEELRADLAAGRLDQSEFSFAIDFATVMDEQLQVRAIEGDAYCLDEIVKPLRFALRKYVMTNTSWHACVLTIGCDMEGDRLAAMFRVWKQAGSRIDAADDALRVVDRMLSIPEASHHQISRRLSRVPKTRSVVGSTVAAVVQSTNVGLVVVVDVRARIDTGSLAGGILGGLVAGPFC